MMNHILPILLGLATAVPPAGAVTEVQIVPAGAQTEIAILTEGPVRVEDFLLRDPARLVVDVHDAAHSLPRYSYEGIARGGVVRMRSSQFRDGVVRLVFDLSTAPEYRVERGDRGVRVRFANPGRSFDRWSTNGTRSAAVPARTARSDAQEAPPAERARQQRSQQPVISVQYDEASMLDVLAGFSEFSGMSIVPSPAAAGLTVRGVDIRNQPWDAALDAILSAQGLGWRRLESGIIIVDELSALRGRDTLQTETRVFRVNYANAQEVAQALENIRSGSGNVVAYQGTNSVIATDAPSVVTRMDSLVSVLDRRTPQVNIEAKIIFVDRTNVNALGIVYELKDVTGNCIADVVSCPDPQNPGETTDETIVRLTGTSVAALANANDRVASPALQILASAAFGDFSLISFIDALEQHQLSDVQAAPSIQVVDNQLARIQVGERTPIRVLESGAQVERARVNVQFEDTGIILEVTPHVTSNNQVLLDLHAERSGLAAAAADIGFIFEKQTGETRLLLEDGETAVIGGLTLSELTRSESGIPILMDLPLIGGLFRTTTENERKQDLIILVTPHIVQPPGERTVSSSS